LRAPSDREAAGPESGCRLPSPAIVRTAPDRTLQRMSPFWIWTQVALVVFVLIGIVIAIVKLT
jgi:hypothetical protein